MKINKILAAGITMIMLAANCNINVWAAQDIPKARIAFTIDDGYADLPEIKEVFDKYNMKASIAVITDFVGHDDSHITQDQLLDFYNDGWEILSHSKTHAKTWSLISSDEVAVECQKAKEYFDKLNIDVNGIAIPFIYIPEEDIDIVKQYYEYYMGFTNGNAPADPMRISRAYFTTKNDNSDEETVQKMKQQIDNLIRTGGSSQYFFHYTRQLGPYLVKPDMKLNVLDEILDYLSQKQDQIIVELPRDIARESKVSSSHNSPAKPVLSLSAKNGTLEASVLNKDSATGYGFVCGKEPNVTLDTPGRAQIICSEIDTDGHYAFNTEGLSDCTIRAYVTYMDSDGKEQAAYSVNFHKN